MPRKANKKGTELFFGKSLWLMAEKVLPNTPSVICRWRYF